MLLRERIFDHPESLIASFLVWVPIAIWIYACIGWMIQTDVDVISGLAGVTLAIGIGLVAMIARDPRVPPLILIAEVVTLAAFPIVRAVLNRHALNAVDAEAIERAYEALSERPGNPGLTFRLAKAVYNRGLVAHAIALAETALQQMPRNLFEEEHGILRGWKRTKQAAEPPRPLPCLDCSTPNEPGLIHCKRCGSPFLLDYARGKWVGRSLARKLVAAWAALMVAIVGIPWASMSLPPAIALVATALLIAVAVGLLVIAFRPKENRLTA
jgi:hypothetical protein